MNWTKTFTVALVFGCLVPAASSAQWSMAGGAGVFVPFEGKAGANALVRALVEDDDSNWRFGGEFEYRNYKSDIFGVKDVGFDSFSLRGIVQYVLPMEPVRPYAGAGIGINLNVFDGSKVERRRSNVETVTDFGTGLGLIGLGGVEFPLGDSMALFGEARVGIDFQLTSESDDIGAENLGGFSGLGGLRVRF